MDSASSLESGTRIKYGGVPNFVLSYITISGINYDDMIFLSFWEQCNAFHDYRELAASMLTPLWDPWVQVWRKRLGNSEEQEVGLPDLPRYL